MEKNEKENSSEKAKRITSRPAKEEFGIPAQLIPNLPQPGASIPVHKEVLEKGGILHRCHHLRWQGINFNPGRELLPGDYGARFSPFKDQGGNLVSYIYAASSPQGALSETLFHDLIGHERTGFLSIRPWLCWGMTQLTTKRDLTLVTLKTADLYRMGLSKELFILSDRLVYAQTRQWAKAIYDQNKDVDGYVWKSRQHDDSDAYIFFGSRVKNEDLAVLKASTGLFDNNAIIYKIREMAKRLGIMLTDE